MKSKRDEARGVHKHADIRPCAVCGLFYPAGREELAASVDTLLKGVPRSESRAIRGIIAPHAGYLYSGPTAASVYGQLTGRKYEVVVIVAPSHKEFFDGVSVYEGAGYATPLGVVPVDEDLRRRLIAGCLSVHSASAGHRAEHAIEVQLPFLQRVLGKFSILPLVVGRQAPETCFSLGEGLATALRGRSALLVASTDLSHFYPGDVARQRDATVIDDVRRFDERGLMDHLQSGAAEACGGGPTVAVMTALKHLGSTRMNVVQYATSGDATGDHRSVVGYLSAVAT